MKIVLFEKIKPLSEYRAPKENIIILKEKLRRNELVYIGIRHRTHPNQATVEYIRKQFQNFIRKHGTKNVIAIIEGPKFKKNIIPEYSNIMGIYRESGVLIPLALGNNVCIKSIEPTHKQLLRFVKKQNLKKENIGLWVFINYLTSIINNNKIPQEKKSSIINLILYLNQELGTVKQKKNPNIDILYKTLIKNLREETKETLLPNNFKSIWKYRVNKKKLIKIQSPNSEQTNINKIGVMFNRARDFFIVQKILKLWQKNNIFVVYGINHLACQKDCFIKNRRE